MPDAMVFGYPTCVISPFGAVPAWMALRAVGTRDGAERLGDDRQNSNGQEQFVVYADAPATLPEERRLEVARYLPGLEAITERGATAEEAIGVVEGP